MALSNGILDGATASVSTDPWGYPGSNCIDGNVATFWHSDGVGVPHWIKFDLGEGNAVAGGDYQLTTRATGDQHAPVDFTYEGSNNDVDWDVLDTQTGITDWVNGVAKEFACSNTTVYRYYRFYVTATTSPDTYCSLGEVGITAAPSGPMYAYPPSVGLNVTPHTPSIPIAFMLPAQLIITAPAPKYFIPVAFPPAVALTLSAPMNAEAGNVLSLLNFNTTPGSEEIIDETGRVWTLPHLAVPGAIAYPNAAVISDDSPFAGVGSLSAPSGLSYIQTPYTPDLDIGDDDFTFECWHKSADPVNGYSAFLCNNSGTPTPCANGIHFSGIGRVDVLCACTDGTYAFMEYIQNLSTAWKHFALVRRGRTFYGFDHGVLTKTATLDPGSNGIIRPPLNGYTIGSALGYASGQINGLCFLGKITGAVFTAGFGKWITNFTPSEEPAATSPIFSLIGRSSVNDFGEISLSALDPTWKTRQSSQLPAVALELSALNPSAVWTLNAAMRPASQVIYICTLTGAPDGVDDAIIPISSFTARMRNGEPSYLSCVIPNSADYEALISARTNGKIIIQKGYRLSDGSVNLAEIARVDYEALMIDRGARNDSATISGHKTTSATSPKERAVQGVSYYGLQADGKRRFRAAIDLFLSPGDTAIYGAGEGDFFVVGSISYAVDINQAIMEVSEE